MNPELFAGLLLAAYVLIGLGLVIWRVLAWPDGPAEWVLTVVIRLHTSLLCRLHIVQRCPWPAGQGILILANHRSPVDPILVYSASLFKTHGYDVRIPEFLTAREYMTLPGFVGWACRVSRCIPVARSGKDMQSVKTALRQLRDNRIVGVFPEGRINTGPGMLPANPGIAWLALKAHVPVYPVYVFDSPVGKTMLGSFLTFTRARVRFGQPICLDDVFDRRPIPETLTETTDRMIGSLALLGGVENPGVAEPDQW